MNKEEYWNDYWQTDGQQGEVLISADGGKPPYLIEFWNDFFRSLSANASVYDMACGAGSIYESMGEDLRGNFSLYGVDVSDQALKILKKRMPEVETVLTSGQRLPFDDNSLEVCVSQFGIEYAGLGGFEEIARVMRKGGKATFLCHIHNGYIDQRNKSYLDGARLVKSSGFIDAAQELTTALFSNDATDLEKANQRYLVSEQDLQKEVGSNVNGIHDHLFHGFRQLKDRYSAYHKSDILNWLSAMEADVDKNIEKVANIREVCLDEKSQKDIKEIFSGASFTKVEFEKFYGTNSDLPVALKLDLTR